MDLRTRALPIVTTATLVMSAMGCVHMTPLHIADTGITRDSRYVTFFVLSGNTSGNADVDRQVKTAIVDGLAEKGLVETPANEAEAVVISHVATSGMHTREAFYRAWGGWAWRAAGDPNSRNGAEFYKPGSVVVDVFDAWSKELLWHGSARDSNSVAVLFKDFPPATRKATARFPGLERDPATPNEPMRIIFSPTPATLIRLDGEPKYEDVAGTDLQRITNADALILRDQSGMHYLRLDDRWLEGSDITGSWSVAGMVPDGAQVALQEDRHPPRRDQFSRRAQNQPPSIYVAMGPAVLIITEGDPQYGTVAGTALLRMQNANASVFKEPTDQEVYVHLTAGWFRAWTTNGPWQAVRDTDLPTDLTRITVQSGPA